MSHHAVPITLYQVGIEAVWASRHIALGRLSAAEQQVFQRLSVPKRRREWLAGRFAAKWAIREQMGRADIAWHDIEVLAVRGGPEHGRPRAFIHGQAAAVDISISHSGAVAIAGATAPPGLRLGIDVEQVVPRAENFEALALTAAERQALTPLGAAARAEAVTQRWALKEALLKATGSGLRARLTDLDIFSALSGAPPIDHPAGGRRWTVAGWGTKMQEGLVYAWVILKDKQDAQDFYN